MRLRRVAALLCLVLTAGSLAGCWDKAELEERAWVLFLGVDKGKESQYAVTAVIALPDKLAGGGKGGGGGGEGKPYITTTVEAPTVAGAMAMMDGYLTRQTSLLHTKVLFMSEELARMSGMFTMDEFVRFRETRRSVMYVVVKGQSRDFLSGLKLEMEKNPQRGFEQLLRNYRVTGITPAASQVQSFVTSVNTGYIAPTTYYAAMKAKGEEKSGDKSSKAESGFKAGELPRKGGPNMELVGAAAFKGEKMVGVLTGDEMRMVLLLQDQFKQGYFSIPDPAQEDLFVSVLLRRGRPIQVGVDLSGSVPRISAVVTLEGQLISTQSNRDYTDPILQGQLEGALEGNLERHIREVITKTQGWESDVAGFGKQVVRHFPTVDAWDRYSWPEKYRDAEISVTVRVTMRRFGLQLSPPSVRGE